MFRTVNKVKCLNERRCYVLADVIISNLFMKCDGQLLQIETAFFITKCDTVYYKLRQVLQSAMDLLQIATGITKCDDYYKLRQVRL